MTKTEQKVFDYARSVEWDYEKVRYYINYLNNKEWYKLNGSNSTSKTEYFIEKYKPKDWREGVEEHDPMYSPKKLLMINEPESITLPIDDYNRLRKLEIKQQIKKLKKELKGL